jgi:hypothetical protein
MSGMSSCRVGRVGAGVWLVVWVLQAGWDRDRGKMTAHMVLSDLDRSRTYAY